jgi:hypothetical protein
MFISNLSICTNYVYYITMLILSYSIYIKFRDLSNILNISYFNAKIVKIIYISVIFFFLAYFMYDNYICYLNYEEYTNNPDTKFIKLSLGLVLLILKLIINKIKEDKIDWSSLLKFSIAIICPILLPPFMDYIMKFENNLHFVLKSLIRSCVQLLAILSILFAMVPALFQGHFLDLNKIILGLSKNYKNIGSNNNFQGRPWNMNIVDNTVNPANNSSSISGPQSGAPSSYVPQAGATSSSVSQPGTSSISGAPTGPSAGQGEDTESSDGKPLFKRPTTRNMADYDSDSDTTQTWFTTRARRINKQNWYRLQNMYDAYAANNPDFPTDEHYESSGEIIRKYVDYRNKKTDGKISIGDLNYLINRNKWNSLPYEELCDLSDDVDYEIHENRKNIKWTKDDLLKLMIDRNNTSNLEEKEEMNTEIKKYIEAIKSYKVTELSLRKEQLALNFRKAGITPSVVSSISEEGNEK